MSNPYNGILGSNNCKGIQFTCVFFEDSQTVLQFKKEMFIMMYIYISIPCHKFWTTFKNNETVSCDGLCMVPLEKNLTPRQNVNISTSA